MNQKLEKYRTEINNINLQLLNLLNNRATVLQEIAALKDETGIEYFDPMRESEMLEMIFHANKGPLPNELIREIFSTVFASSLHYMGNRREKKLLIGSDQQNGFLNMAQMFNLQVNEPIIIAGPCAVESIEYLEKIAVLLKEYGIKFIRAGAFKPRTSPYEFQGLGEEGLKMLHVISKKYDLISITEVVDTRDIEVATKYVDIIQIGARNMHNFELLKEVGQLNHPILLKRGLSATMQEFMFAAEYVALKGNRKIILCERGIRTFENKTRNTLDISSIPIIKKETSLPILIDLSHSLGRKDIINPIAKAAIAVGADGIMVEVHPFPELALSDSKQQLNPEEFIQLLKSIDYC